jgi:hypothetical protein
MIYKEEVRNLFEVPKEYYLAHCISADFGMGKGIAVEFNKRFNMKETLLTKYPNYLNQWDNMGLVGECILEGRVLNLVTKDRYFNKPTYKSMLQALREMQSLCWMYGIDKIAMPIIGCGLDRLEWPEVRDLIKDVFKNDNIEIIVCKHPVE